MDIASPTRSKRGYAIPGWAVHTLTASGAVLAFLAFLAVEQGQPRLAFLWLGAALIVDGIDGPLARKAKVAQRTPKLDGVTLDLVVDYLNYVFVPAVLVYRAGLLPPLFDLVAIAVILLSALYTFARTDMKTSDNFFRGFPALWNVVAFYLFMLHPGPVTCAIVVGVFATLTFAPVYFVHPMRARMYQPWLGIVTALWGTSSCLLLFPDFESQWGTLLLAASLVGAMTFIVLSVLRTIREALSSASA